MDRTSWACSGNHLHRAHFRSPVNAYYSQAIPSNGLGIQFLNLRSASDFAGETSSGEVVKNRDEVLISGYFQHQMATEAILKHPF